MFRLNVRVERLGDDVAFDERAEEHGLAHAAKPEHAGLRGDMETMHEMPGSVPCPSCGSREVYRSKARTLYERLKKAHTLKRVFRCHHCGWRGWLPPLEHASITEATGSPDLTAIDASLGIDQLRDAIDHASLRS